MASLVLVKKNKKTNSKPVHEFHKTFIIIHRLEVVDLTMVEVIKEVRVTQQNLKKLLTTKIKAEMSDWRQDSHRLSSWNRWKEKWRVEKKSGKRVWSAVEASDEICKKANQKSEDCLKRRNQPKIICPLLAVILCLTYFFDFLAKSFSF